LSWYDAHAFCIWDGGFLPSEAEWNYAAAGGSEQRLYPWGSAPPGANATLAIYDCCYAGPCSACGVHSIAPVGSAPSGNGKYGQADLAGNLLEWNLDWAAEYPTPCNDCAQLTTAAGKSNRGGDFYYKAASLVTSVRNTFAPTIRLNDLGARCARAP
jgi:formylglycine-generating enzyme required for sulfatase activity